MTTPRFVGYWLGYVNPLGNALNTTPTSVTNINLFVAGITNTGSLLDTDYLTSNCPASQMQTWAHDLQAQGQQVSMTLMDSGTIHWNNVDIPSYCANVNEVALGQWGLDGIDIDAESGMPDDVYVDTMVSLVTNMRSAIGPDALLTYVCYTLGTGVDSNHDAEILPQINDSINWINTMGYFWSTSQQQAAFDLYANIVGPEKVNIGVGCGYGNGHQFTPLSECATLAAWQPSGASKCGMMTFNLNNDNPSLSGKPIWTWTDTIANNLTGGASAKARKERSATPQPRPAV